MLKISVKQAEKKRRGAERALDPMARKRRKEKKTFGGKEEGRN